ncbi:MAG: isopeptide-forming domain-containing fimbrial protein, partial [Acidimicrobiia bacterium]
MKIRRLVVGTSVLSLVAGPTALLPMTAGADDNAATANMTVGCEARPAVTVGSQGGLPAVVPGERVTLHSSAHFDAGTVYQAALTRPDGSRYFAAAIELTPEVSAVFSPDANSLLLTQDGTPIALSSGTQPAVGTFVFDTSAPVGTYRVFFPGDAATMLADPQGFGLASFVVGPAGMSLDLAINGTVNDVPSSISGAVLPIGRCQQSVSSGPSNRSVQEQFASVGITEPTIELTKATASPAVAPGGIARWSLRVAAPARTAAGNLVAPAQGVVIVDAIPVGLEPVDDGGGALADGGSTSSGGVWSVGARTLTWSLPTVAAGANQTLSYSTRVDSGFNPLDSTVLTNNASATYRSLPAVSGGGRSYSAGPVSQNVVVGIMPPQIAKSVNRPHVGFGTEVTYTVDVTIPASAATDYSATIVDRLPSGLSFVAVDSITCVSGCPGGDPAPATLPSYVAGTGETTWGIYLGNLAPSADRVYQVTYRAMTAASATAAYGYGTTLTNSASISFDAQDRLGGAVPNTAALPLWDVTRTATADITLDRPTLTIKKSLISSPNPWDPNSNRVVFQLDVENTSTMNATNILIEDQQPEEWWVDTGGIMADGGAIFNVLGDWPLLSGTLDSVPAGATVHITIPISYRSGERLGLPISYVNTARISEYTDEFGSVINSRPGSPYVIPASSASVTPLVPHLSITKSVPTIVATSSLVTYTVTVTNDSDATATNIQIDDRFGESADSQWDYQEGSAVGGGVIEQWGWGGNENFVLPDLAPHSSATFTYQVLAPDHVVNTQRNTVDIRWSDGGGHWGYQLCTALKCDYRDFHATASAVTDVAVPQLSLVKGPKEDSFVPAGGTVVFNVDVTNPGSVPLTNVDITDVMPATLTYLSHSATTTGGPFTIAVDSSDPSNPHFTIPVLPPGAALHLLITARQDGSAPPGTGPDRFELVNVASAIADQIPTPVTDTGSTLYVPNIVRPTLSKTVSPAVAKPGDVVDWAVTIDVPSNVVDMYDEVIIDKVPDGLTAITPTSVTCNSGPCPTVTALSPMLPAPLPVTGDHATYAGWWLGDVPAGTAFNLTIHYTTQIESALDDGTLVLDGQATEPLDNRARGFYNTSDTYATESDVATFLRAPNSKWNGRTIVAKAEVDIVTPNVTIEKTMTTHQKWTWKNQAGLPSTTYAASAGDTLGYQLRVCNIGSSTAYDTTIVDDMGLGNLRSVTINPSAAAIVDGWSDPDPTATWALASLAPGACENITYSGTSWDSAHLIPAYSGVNSDVAAITNTATIGAFHTVPAAGVGDIIYGPRSAAPVTTLIMTPFVRVRGECAQADRGVAKTFTTRFWAFADGGVLWTPRDAVGLDPSIGGLHNARIEMWLAPGLEFVPGSVRASGQHMGTATPVAFRDPDSVTTAPDGRTILRWDEPYLEYQSTLNASLELSMSAINQSASPTAQVPVGGHLSGLDGNGSGSRGHAVVADYDYLDEHYGCGGRQLVISKRPEPGRPYYDTWKFFPDESFDFWGSWVGGDSADANGRGRISTSAVVTDTMPDGPAGYVPGSAQFTLYRMDGTTTTFTAASLSETITNLPGGRTRIEWTNWPEAHYRVDYRIPGLSVPAARTDLLNTTLTNDIRIVDPIDWPGALSGACGLPAATSCDTAPIFIKGPTQVNVTKVVDDETPHEWGTTRTWTVTATVKAGSNLNEFTVIDDQAWSSGFSPTFDPFLNGAYLSASCIGCPGTDPAITTLPRIMNGTGHAMGWSMGDLPPAGADRIYTLRYTTISSPLADAPVGFTADSANKILRFENSATARWTALDVPAGYDPVAQGTNWWISLQDSGNTCVLSGGCTESDADVRGIQLGFPWLTLTKDCVSVDGSSYVYDLNNAEYGDTVHPEPPRNLPGQPNLTCHLAVTNSGAAPAVNFAVRDTPDPVGDYWGSNPQWWPNNPSPVAWEVLSATGPFPASTTWGDSGSSFIAWAAGPADPIEPGETWEFNLTMHVDGWSGDPGQSSNYGRNQSTLSSWTDENGNAIGSPTTRSEVAHFVRPEVRLDKGFWKQPTSTTSDGLDFWSLQSLVAQPLGGPEFAMVGATQSVALLARVARPTQIGSLAVADELPGHMSYVPGSARLQHIVSIDPSFNTAPTIISIPIPDPARSTASVSPDRCTSGARGETLTWNFSASGTGWERAPWDTAFQYLTEAQSSEISYGDGGKTLVVFDVVAASDLFIACPATNTAGAPVVVTENRGMLTAT